MIGDRLVGSRPCEEGAPGLFVILWVLKPGPKQDMTIIDGDWIKQVAAIRDAFGYIPDPASKDPVDVHMLMKKLEQLEHTLITFTWSSTNNTVGKANSCQIRRRVRWTRYLSVSSSKARNANSS